MEPKLKAKDLYVKFSDYCSWNTFEEEQDYINNIKKCALIALDEILETNKDKWATQRKFQNGEYKFLKGVAYKN